MVPCKENHILFLKNWYEFELGFEANRLLKEFKSKGWKRPL